MNEKETLLNFMRVLGFDYICDVAMYENQEMVASKRQDGELWWRSLEVEGSGFTRLFQGSIREMLTRSVNVR